jgi:hypothetical protein
LPENGEKPTTGRWIREASMAGQKKGGYGRAGEREGERKKKLEGPEEEETRRSRGITVEFHTFQILLHILIHVRVTYKCIASLAP